MNEYFCDFEAPILLFFSENIPSLLYYSHLTAVSAALIVVFLLASRRDSRRDNILLISILLFFSMWALIDIFLWATNDSGLVMFWWSIQILIEPLIYLLSILLFYKYVSKKFPSFSFTLFTSLAVTPLIIFLPTDLTIYAVNLFDCTALESSWIVYYTYLLEILSILSVLLLLVIEFFKGESYRSKKISVIFAFGIIAFLGSFTIGNIIGSFGGTTYDWEVAQYGLFGMPIFIGLLTYLIVEYKILNLKLIGAQALVVSLWFLVGSLLFVAQSTTTRVVAGVTLVFTSIAGYFLVRSVKKEVKQREEIEKLAKDLQVANDKLKVLDRLKSEFVSIASHQLRSPLTAIRGYASMLAEGSYGKLPQKAQEISERIAESSKYMALSVEDYLNVSRIEAGNMKYERSDFNMKDVAEKIVDELRPVAMKKGLVMVFRSECAGSCSVNADIGKTRQIIMNLLDNSMKYTPKGTVTVVAHDDVTKKKMYITIQDTGIGMSKETAGEVFEKFVRAKNANSVNTTGTGLGLYIAKKMIKDMSGDIKVESEGEGKGSTFTIELPLLPGNARGR